LRDERQREHGAVNEGTLQYESIQRLNGRGEGGCVKGKEMIKAC